MTLGAIEVASMVERLVGQAQMLVDMWQPDIGHVADIALLVRNEVSVILAGGYVAVMAGRARTQDLCVVYVGCRRPDRRGVTVLAHIRCQDVCRMFASRVSAVVTTDAVARDIDVIEIGRNPRVGCVAVVAVVTTRDVRRVLAGCCVAIVAGAAGPEYLGVINHIGRRPDDVVMAVLADIGR